MGEIFAPHKKFKRLKCRATTQGATLSQQNVDMVLQEFCSPAVTKQRLKMTHDDAIMKDMLGNGDQQIFAIRYEWPDRSDVQDHHGAFETLRHALGRR